MASGPRFWDKTLATSRIKYADDSDRDAWDDYVRRHPHAGASHLFGWRDVIRKAYGHQAHYLMALRGDAMPAAGRPAQSIGGALPLVHLKHVIFGNSLVSLPFLDAGGILSDCREAEESLLSEAMSLGLRIGASRIELRCERAVAACDRMISSGSERWPAPVSVSRRSGKVRMLLTLPPTSDALVRSFKSKLRSQINRPLKEGCTSSIGGLELLEDFYKVFLVNMRDLGSPVHSVELMRQVLREFPERARILVVRKSGEPLAAALVIGFDKVLQNPWTSCLREYASLSPNMLLYLRMLEYACDNGYQVFDFGRSTAGEGTYKFKEQWGAVPAPLYWYCISLGGRSSGWESSGTERFEKATRYWKKLPVSVTKVIGPVIRKYISL